MYILGRKISKSSVIQLILKNIDLFESFENIYLFGSLVRQEKNSEDVDVLLVYKRYLLDVLVDIDKLSTFFEEKHQLTFDLTILSVKELTETNFIERLSSCYLKLK